MQRQFHRGFTLVELIISLAIIGILASVAIPSYETYVIRSKIVDGLQQASAAKNSVSSYMISMGTLPDSNDTAGIRDDIETVYLRSLKITADGAVQVTFRGEQLRTGVDQTFVLTPQFHHSGAVLWACDPPGTLDPKFLPRNCSAPAI